MHAIPPASRDLVRQALQDFPRPDRLAQHKLGQWLTQQGIEDSPQDVEVVTFHYQHEPDGEGRMNLRYNAVITQQMDLVQALLGNWQGESAGGFAGFHYGDWAGSAPPGPLTLVARLEPQSAFSNASAYLVFNGLYRRRQPPRYDPDTRLAVRAEDLQTFIWSQHFHNAFKACLDQWWAARQAQYQQALRIAFIAACNRQTLAGSLSEAGRRLAWQAAGLLPRHGLQLSMLNVYGYSSTDILRIGSHAAAPVLLYVPGNAMPLHEFANQASLQHWFARQCQAPQQRRELLKHFARADWPDGLDFSGLRTALEGLGLYPNAHHFPSSHPGFATSGVWDPGQIVDYQSATYSPPIAGELFEYLTLRQKRRAYADADSQIISNHDIDKRRWSSYLDLAVVILAPLAVVLPELAPVLLLGGVAEFSLGLEQAINGKSLQAKADGVRAQAFGLFNALPSGATLLGRPGQVFGYARPGFFVPARLRQLFGSAFGAAPTPGELDAIELAFRRAPVVSPNTTAALVARVEDHLGHRFAAWLATDDGLVDDWVSYELASDSFIRDQDVQLPNPPRWSIANEGDSALVRSSGQRQASDAQRMATLRALGIELDLPIDYARYPQLPRSTLPKVLSSVWLGDQRLAGEFLEALVHNAQVLRGSDWRLQILLSRQDRSVYLDNLATLSERAEGALLMPLEDQGFFRDFQRTAYFAQYQRALTGPAPNYASACDILRYRLLKHYGGLYLDADDRLLPASAADSLAPILSLELKASHDGLLLSPPVSNEQMGLFIKYNSSMLGSHAGNPTLDAISDEILRRYAQVPDFYDSRPDPQLLPLPFQAYARRLSLLSGPGVLNAVIDARLPLLRQLREICNLLVSPIYDLHARLDLSQFAQVMREQVPLDRIAKMGSAHSWAQPRQR